MEIFIHHFLLCTRINSGAGCGGAHTYFQYSGKENVEFKASLSHIIRSYLTHAPKKYRKKRKHKRKA
jgi:hypothetical protein